MGQRAPRLTQTEKQTTNRSKSKLHRRQRLHRDPPLTPSEVGHLPDWIPGTKAALLHHGKLITKKQDDYVTTAATAPLLCKRLIKKSKRHDPFLEQDWDAATFKDIDWKGM
jgi:hypothetical protein